MNILEQIIDQKRDEIATRRSKVKVSTLREMESFDRTPSSLRQSVEQHPVFGVIAEVKRSSPSAGNLRSAAAADAIAKDFQRHGAAGVSVLTDEKFFSGSLEDLAQVRAAVSIPLLRKDFIIHEYQVVEAKAFGADAVLLIAAILDASHLSDLYSAAAELGLECLVELYESSEIDILDFDRMKLIGINNRDLRTFQVDIQRSINIAQDLPKGITVVSESGIHSPGDLRRLSAVGIRAALIGEHFMKSDQPGDALKNLLEMYTDDSQ